MAADILIQSNQQTYPVAIQHTECAAAIHITIISIPKRNILSIPGYFSFCPVIQTQIHTASGHPHEWSRHKTKYKGYSNYIIGFMVSCRSNGLHHSFRFCKQTTVTAILFHLQLIAYSCWNLFFCDFLE